MAQLSLVVGVFLVVLGVSGYWASDMVSVTALIPAFFGVVIVGLGAMARSEARRKMAMHIAMGVAVLGILGTVGGLVGFVSNLVNGTPLSLAIVSRTLMATALVVYLVMGVRSFIAARQG